MTKTFLRMFEILNTRSEFVELNISPRGAYRCGLSKILALFNDSSQCSSRNGNGGKPYILKFFGSKIPDNNRFEKVVTDEKSK